jgi:hypothetical protein
MIIHDIEVNDVGTCVEHSLDIITKAGEIGR